MITHNKKPELLAPVGGKEQLKAAINFGADAVYLSGKQFGMRAKAQNFELDELKEAVSYSHDKNVSVYVTCNVLMYDSDIDKLIGYCKFLESIKIDGVIVSDLGAVSIIRKHCPNLNIHISTQASTTNSYTAKVWANLGAKRVVLAREMTLKQIESLTNVLNNNKIKVAVECFVHGAMCMSVSGRCLISAYLTGRSANRGLCTQPCRWGYNLVEERRPGQNFEILEDNYGSYIMNSHDMCMIEHLDKLANAGIDSFKIEGRNKKSLYVATVVNAYRHVIDAIGTKDYKSSVETYKKEMYKVSHRPYSTGFYFSNPQQSVDYDGYEQECIHVAEVVSCADDTVTVLCRNRFENNQELEALIPGGKIEKFKISSLTYKNKRIDVANRAKEMYTFKTNKKLLADSLIRTTQYLRTKRK